MAKYPAQIDDNISLPLSINNTTPVSADTVNKLRSAIIAIESELGVKPSGTFGTVRARLDFLETHIAGSSFTAAHDLTGTNLSQTVIGLRGRQLSNVVPSDGYVLTWSASSNAWKPLLAASAFTAGGDLTGTISSQQVISLTGSAGIVSIPSASLSFTINAATDGIIRLPSGSNVSGRSDDNTKDLVVFDIQPETDFFYGNIDSLSLGSDYNFTASKAFDTMYVNANDYISFETAGSPNVQIELKHMVMEPGNNFGIVGQTGTPFFNNIFGDGYGVMLLGNANTVPTSNPTAGILLYAESGVAKIRQTDGMIFTLGPGFTAGGDLSGTNTSQTVVGIENIAISSSSAPPIGGTQVYNTIGGASYKQKKPVMPGCFDVQDFGAIPDYNMNTYTGTDNYAAFVACLAAAKAYTLLTANHASTIIVNGHYYLSQGLQITQTITLQGNGRAPNTDGGNRSSPGSLLAFPANVTGIQIMSGYTVAGTGHDTCINDIMIVCSYVRAQLDPMGQDGYGIWINAPAHLNNVGVENFGSHGIFVDAGSSPGDTPGNAGGFTLTKCIIGGCGGDGIKTTGSDANVGLISACESVVNWGYGVNDDSVLGNTYIGHHCEGNKGYVISAYNHDYKTRGEGTNSSMFFSCYTEAAKNSVDAPAICIGGLLGDASNHIGTCLCLGRGNQISNYPLTYINDLGSTSASVEFGQRSSDGDVFSFTTPAPIAGFPGYIDYNTLRFNLTTAWWGILNNHTETSRSIQFPTSITSPRRFGPLFEQGITFGSPLTPFANGASKALTTISALPSLPVGTNTGDTYEVGDVIFNTAPTEGSVIGWRCLSAGTIATNTSPPITGDITIGTNILYINPDSNIPAYLRPWDYITIAGVSGTKQITKIPYGTGSVLLDSNADATVSSAAIGYTAPIFENLGGGNIGFINTLNQTSVNAAVVNMHTFQGVGNELTLSNSKSYLINIHILGSRTDALGQGAVIHNLLVHTTGGTLFIDDDTTDYNKLAVGWAVNISAPGGLILRVAVNGAAGQTVDFSARVKWTELGGV